MQGRARLIEQEQDEVLEGELASAGKVLRILAVGGDEGGTIERLGLGWLILILQGLGII